MLVFGKYCFVMNQRSTNGKNCEIYLSQKVHRSAILFTNMVNGLDSLELNLSKRLSIHHDNSYEWNIY